jgi:hypothetical protein
MTDFPEVPDLIYPETGNKKSGRSVRPWDIFNKNVERATDSVQKERMSICLQCPKLIKATRQCKECGCFMDAKTRLLEAECPLSKWDKIIIDENEFDYKKDK